MNLYVMRHGEVEANVKNKINGRNNDGLNHNGIIQAKSKKEEINKLCIDIIICSPLERAKETCYYATNGTNQIIYDERLVERDSNSMMYEPVSKLDKNIWYDENKEIVYSDSEGFKSILNRTYELLNEIKVKYKDSNILLITHGDVCKAIYKYFKKDIVDISEFEQNNCEIIKYKL